MGIPTKVTPGAHPPEKPSPALVFDTLMAHQRTAALRAAIELDVFRAVGEGPGDVASLARRCSASERGIRILCDYLTIIGAMLCANSAQTGFSGSTKPWPSRLVRPLRTTSARCSKGPMIAGLLMKRAVEATQAGERGSRNVALVGVWR